MIIAVKCPSCNANLQIPDDVEFVTCEFCGTTIKVRDVVRIETDYDVPEWLKIAENAYKGENYDEAYDYYNMVLEKESFRYNAWIGKGLSAGWQSEENEPRLDEMMQLVDYGISKTEPKLLEEERAFVKKEIQPILENFFGKIKRTEFSDRDDYNEFIKRYTPLLKTCEKVYKDYYAKDIEFIRFCAEVFKIVCDIYQISERNEKTIYLEIPEPKKTEYLNFLHSIEKELKLSDRSYISFDEIQRKETITRYLKRILILTVAAIIFGGFYYILTSIGNTPARVTDKEVKTEKTIVKDYTIYSDFIKNNNIYYTVYAYSQSLSHMKNYANEIIAKDDSKTDNTIIYFFGSKEEASKFSNKEVVLKKNQSGMSMYFSACVKFNTENDSKEIFYYEKSKLKSEKFR